jgi:hypothetical protein
VGEKLANSYTHRLEPKPPRATDETLDLFLTQEAAEAELREIFQDEPEWVNVLSVVPIELDGRPLSAN